MVKAHSVRSMGTSLAFMKNASLKEVMETAMWSSNLPSPLFMSKMCNISMNTSGPWVLL